jgi:hypothetical protein
MGSGIKIYIFRDKPIEILTKRLLKYLKSVLMWMPITFTRENDLQIHFIIHITNLYS